jgi:hypothetical protein
MAEDNCGEVMQPVFATSFALNLPPSDTAKLNGLIAWFDQLVLGGAEEKEQLTAGSDKRNVRLVAHMGNCIGLTAKPSAEAVHVSGQGQINLPGFAALLQCHFPQCLPAQITWAVIGPVCTGGWMVVDTVHVHCGNASQAVSETARELSRERPPSRVQLEAARAYADYDMGHLDEMLKEPPPLLRETLSSTSFGDFLGAYLWAECGDAENANEAADQLRNTCVALHNVAEALDCAAAHEDI